MGYSGEDCNWKGDSLLPSKDLSMWCLSSNRYIPQARESMHIYLPEAACIGSENPWLATSVFLSQLTGFWEFFSFIPHASLFVVQGSWTTILNSSKLCWSQALHWETKLSFLTEQFRSRHMKEHRKSQVTQYLLEYMRVETKSLDDLLLRCIA